MSKETIEALRDLRAARALIDRAIEGLQAPAPAAQQGQGVKTPPTIGGNRTEEAINGGR